MAKIEELTPEEKALILIVRDEWIKIGLATGPTDRLAAQRAIADAYRLAGMEPPKLWIWLGSPWAGCIGAWMLTKLPAVGDQVRRKVEGRVWDQMEDQDQDQVQDEVWYHAWDQAWGLVGEQLERQMQAQAWTVLRKQVERQMQAKVRDKVGGQVEHQRSQAVYGQQSAGWLASYDLTHRRKRVKLEALEPLIRSAMSAGWWWPFAGACIITERPCALYHDEAFRLHCDSGPALAYPDGWAIHAWHGLRIPARLIKHRHKVTPDNIEAEKNAELRRVMLEIFGFDRYIEARGAKLIAEDECLGLPRQLFEIDLRGERIRVLRVANGTVEADGRQRQFYLGMPLECNTPHEAVAWSYGRPPAIHRENIRS